MPVKRPPLLRPTFQLLVIPTLPRDVPPQKAVFVRVLGRFDARVGGAHEALAQVFEAVLDVLRAVAVEVEVFEISCARGGRVDGGIVGAAQGVEAVQLVEGGEDGEGGIVGCGVDVAEAVWWDVLVGYRGWRGRDGRTWD